MGYKTDVSSLPKKFLNVDKICYRLSRGPNGHALHGAAYEAGILPKGLLESLDVINPGIKAHIESIVINKLQDFQEHSFDSTVEKPRNLFRKISAFADKEGKMRVIGVLDY